MTTQFDYEPPTARRPRREPRHHRVAYEVGAILLALFVLASIVHLVRHFVIFVAKIIGGAS